MHDALDLRDLLPDELRARTIAGFDVRGMDRAVRRAVAMAVGPQDPSLAALYDVLEQRPQRAGTHAYGPDDLSDSLNALPQVPEPAVRCTPDNLEDRVHGAWLGRCAGCVIGKPVEGWTHQHIRAYAFAAGAYPIEDFLPPPIGALHHVQSLMKPSWVVSTRGRIDGMPRDDDIDYTILALHILEAHGSGFTTDDVAAEFLDHLALTDVFTAERVAHRNLGQGVPPSQAATVRNPYREWIGGLIRADLYGYVSPGNPRRAAGFAARDAALSHRGVGLHAAMWAAALIAECLVRDDAVAAVYGSLNHIPPGGRLAQGLIAVLNAFEAGSSWEQARREIAHRYAGYSWVHAQNNAAVIVAALLWGGTDFATTVGLAVAAGWDTDSTGATAGSAIGAIVGAAGLPTRFTTPLADRTSSALADFDGASIADLARRTYRLALQEAV